MAWLFRSAAFWVLLVAACVSAPLIIWATNPVQLVQVYVQPDAEDDAWIVSKATVVRATRGQVAFDFEAMTTDTSVTQASLVIRLNGTRHPQNDSPSVRVIDGTIKGVATLGSPEAPLDDDANYTFSLISRPDGMTLLDGRIIADVTEIAGAERAYLTAVGILASAIQIAQALAAGFQARLDSQNAGRPAVVESSTG